MNTPFPITSFIKSGWQTFKNNWKFIILAAIATAVVQMILNLIQRGAEHSGMFANLIASLFVGIVGLIVALGWAQVTLSLNRNDNANWNTFKTSSKLWIHYIKTMIWYFLYLVMWALVFVLPPAILTLIGFLTGVQAIEGIGWIISVIAFVGLAIYFGLKYQFVSYAVLDYQHLRSKAVFKKAGEITKGHLWHLFCLAIVLLLLNLVGLICLVVGLAVTIPVSKLASARAYDYLKGKHASQPQVVVTETVIVEEIIG